MSCFKNNLRCNSQHQMLPSIARRIHTIYHLALIQENYTLEFGDERSFPIWRVKCKNFYIYNTCYNMPSAISFCCSTKSISKYPVIGFVPQHFKSVPRIFFIFINKERGNATPFQLLHYPCHA